MPELNSFSSSFMLGTTLYRNQEGVGNKLIAQVGYALTTAVATVESISAVAISALSLIAYPFSSTPFDHSTKWLSSSAFSLGWSIVDFALNPFLSMLVADEKSARIIASSGKLTEMPSGSLYQ